jgi:FkbH-like protein
LDLQIRIAPAATGDTARVAQLTQKTNQFNLTTRRYSEADISRMASSADCSVLTLHVSDRFGDSGLSGVCIAHRLDAIARIDTFLLSCRVLGRGIEEEFAARCIEILARKWSVAELGAEYVRTSKNGQAEGFWADLGLTSDPAGASGMYRGAVSRAVQRHASYIKVLP